MDAFIFDADIYCEDCGAKIREDIDREGKAPADPDDESTYDSGDYPKGPFPDGGGEADHPQHCGAGADCCNAIELSDGSKVGAFLENPLTSEGVQYVKDKARDDPASEVVKLWCDHYGITPEYRGPVTASFKLGDRDYSGIPVINPGGWFGKTWLITLQMGYDADLFIVEADSVSDAIDEFSDSEFGHWIHVAPEDEGDYPEESRHYDGSGRLIDLEHLGIEGQEGYRNGQRIEVPFECRYHADGLPAAGIDPRKLELYEHADA